MQDLLDKTRQKREADAKRFVEADHDLCMLCWAYGADKRSLILTCLYDIGEMGPEFIDLGECTGPLKDRGFYLRICKSCRSKFLGYLQRWRDEQVGLRDLAKDHDGGLLVEDDPERNIPYRINGATVMLTHEEWLEKSD